MTRQLAISPELSLPAAAVTETFGILAVKRAGKSNAGVVMAEEMFDAGLPWVAIDPKGDWWGVRASADGKGPGLPVVVFGGEHGDVPLEETSGRLIADLVVDQRLTCVLDISTLMDTNKSAARRFLTDFAERLYARNREPLHVFCEEADEYIPQLVRGDAAKMVGAYERLVKRGGFRGIGITLITQRSASLNKDVLTQIGTLIAMQTTSPQDRKAILGWVVQHALGQELVDGLPTLAKGEAWVFSPAWLGILKKITFRRRRTFDSGATPTAGAKARPPATLADVDLAGLRTLMASTIEKAKADDPRELRKKIQQLQSEKRDLDAKVARIQKELLQKEAVRVEVPVYPDKVKDWLRDTAGNVDAAAKQLVDLAKMLRAGADIKVSATDRIRREIPAEDLIASSLQGRTAQPVERAGAGADRQPPRSRPPAAEARSVPPAEQSNGHHVASGPQQRILDALAWAESARIPQVRKVQLALLADASPKSSAYTNNLGALRTAGLLTYPGPGLVALTAGGRAQAREDIDVPTTSEDLHRQLFSRLSGSQVRILQQLIRLYPESIDKADLAEKAAASATSSAFTNNLGALRSLGLIDYPSPGQVAALPVLFLEEAAVR